MYAGAILAPHYCCGALALPRAAHKSTQTKKTGAAHDGLRPCTAFGDLRNCEDRPNDGWFFALPSAKPHESDNPQHEQVLTAAMWAANMAATRSKGRLDGSNRRDSSGGGGGSGSKKKAPAPPPVRFFSPAGWAFAIWGPIFLGEQLSVGAGCMTRRRGFPVLIFPGRGHGERGGIFWPCQPYAW